MTLYNLKRTGDGYTMVKWDADLNVEAVYELTPLKAGLQSLACNCPAGHRHTCRHRKMIPIFIARGAVDTQQFYDYEHQFWQQPIPTDEAHEEPSATKAANLSETCHADITASEIDRRMADPTTPANVHLQHAADIVAEACEPIVDKMLEVAKSQPAPREGIRRV